MIKRLNINVYYKLWKLKTRAQLFKASLAVQSIVSLTSSLLTNSLTVAKVFPNTLIFALQKLLTFFQQKKKIKLNVFAIFPDRNFNVTLANNFVQF